MKEEKIRVFGLGFTLINKVDFIKTKNIVLQQHWTQVLQIGLST
jgi:hypothetical protein